MIGDIVLCIVSVCFLVILFCIFALFIFVSVITMLEDLPSDSPVRRFFHRFLSRKGE